MSAGPCVKCGNSTASGTAFEHSDGTFSFICIFCDPQAKIESLARLQQVLVGALEAVKAEYKQRGEWCMQAPDCSDGYDACGVGATCTQYRVREALKRAEEEANG